MAGVSTSSLDCFIKQKWFARAAKRFDISNATPIYQYLLAIGVCLLAGMVLTGAGLYEIHQAHKNTSSNIRDGIFMVAAGFLCVTSGAVIVFVTLLLYHKMHVIGAQRDKAHAHTIWLMEQYKMALDRAAIFALTDNRGTITYVNDQFCRISKYDRDELIGANHRILKSGVHDEAFFRDLYKTVIRDGIWRNEICNRAKDGSLYWVDTTIIAFRNKRGEVEQYAVIRADITERKRAEAKLQHARDEIEARNQELEQFTYSISHDLKTPLTSCFGMINCIEEDLDKHDDQLTRTYIDRAMSNLAKMRQRIDDILMLSRIGRIRHEPERLNMVATVKRVVDDLLPQSTKAHAEVIVSPDMPDVVADPVRMIEVIENLIDNAMKHARTDAPLRVEVGGRLHEDEVHYYVRDNGQGIPEAYQHKIFNLFERLDANSEGSGIGLTAVKRIMEVHKGRIWIESEPGQGTTFWLAFRQHQDEQALI